MDAARLSDAAGGIGLVDPGPEPLVGISGIVFELPGVLYEATVWRRWLLRLLSRMGLHAQYDAFFDAWENDYLDDVYAGERQLNDALSDYLQAAGLARALVGEVVAAAAAQRKSLETQPRPLPGVVAAIDLLSSKGLLLALSADSDQATPELRDMLQKLGVGKRFREVISSRDVRAAKPAPAGYLAAAAALKLAPQQVAFVGHRAAHIAGAREVGMATIALGCVPCAIADRHVPRIEQLNDLFPAVKESRRAG